MGILLGLGSALAFGTGDFLARFAARRIGNFRTLLYMQLIGLIGLSLWLALVDRPSSWDWSLVALAALLAVGNTIAGLALYRAFEVGVISVVSPIAASYGAISLMLGLLTGQKPSVLQLVGLVITIGGVVLSSTPLFQPKEVQFAPTKGGNGIGLALLASLCFGVTFWGLGYVSPTLGGVVPVWETRIVGPLLVLSVSGPLRQSLGLPHGRIWLLVTGIAVFDTTAFLLLNYGLRLTDSSIVSVLSSLFSAFTILLAFIFLREKLASNQWVGVVLIMVGIGLVSAG